jgi:hypothetical protein
MKQMIPAIAAAAFFIATPALAGAQTPPPSPSPSPTAAPAPEPSQAPAPMAERRSAKAETAKGELVKVDADAKSLTIKGSDGVETVFAYNDATEVAGGRDGVAGLATKAGSKVTVHFTSAAGAKTATKIEVQGGADAPK